MNNLLSHLAGGRAATGGLHKVSIRFVGTALDIAFVRRPSDVQASSRVICDQIKGLSTNAFDPLSVDNLYTLV